MKNLKILFICTITLLICSVGANSAPPITDVLFGIEQPSVTKSFVGHYAFTFTAQNVVEKNSIDVLTVRNTPLVYVQGTSNSAIASLQIANYLLYNSLQRIDPITYRWGEGGYSTKFQNIYKEKLLKLPIASFRRNTTNDFREFYLSSYSMAA